MGSGCVHVYEPMSGLHRPVVIDTHAANFTDLRLDVVCPAGGAVNSAEAQLLCDRVGKLFETQGATVTTAASRGAGATGEDDAVPEAAVPATDLVMELRSRELHTSNDPLSWILCMATATLVPAVTESTFAQDIVIRDSTGFLIASDSLQGRIVRTFGLGTWAGNALLDVVWRKKADELTEKAMTADLSADLYTQLSQILFNAKMRWRVLQEATPAGRATVQKP